MMKFVRLAIPVGALVALMALPAIASAAPPPVPAADTHVRTPNLQPIGYSEKFSEFTSGTDLNSDLAFWERYAFQGSYDGFRILDVSFPANPREIAFESCTGNQGDIVVWGNILVRSWNSPAAAGATCDSEPVVTGFEGVHVFDITDIEDPVLVGEVELADGSHTATLIPDLKRDRLLVYSQTSGNSNSEFDLIEVPIESPEEARLLKRIALDEADGCHDAGAILGDVNLLACASHDHANVYDIGKNRFPGGSLDTPKFLYTVSEPGVGDGSLGSGNWHSASFTWDGEVLILGWEPGGGTQPRCTATGTSLPVNPGQPPLLQSDIHKTMFFYRTTDGRKVGQWTLPRNQILTENCTIHNYNTLPTKKRYVVVSGNYQSGISVVDFTNPRKAREIAYADPAPLSTTQLFTAGDWSSYWYNGNIYESDIRRGLLTWRLRDDATSGVVELGHANPQTQEFSFEPRRFRGNKDGKPWWWKGLPASRD